MQWDSFFERMIYLNNRVSSTARQLSVRKNWAMSSKISVLEFSIRNYPNVEGSKSMMALSMEA